MNDRPQLNFVLGTFFPRPIVYSEHATIADAEANRHVANMRSMDEQYEPMSKSEWLAGRRRFYLRGALQEVTESDYDEALGCVPPRRQGWHGGVFSFDVGEMLAGPFTRQYADRAGRFFTRVVDVTDTATWITAGEIDRLFPGHVDREAARRSTGAARER